MSQLTDALCDAAATVARCGGPSHGAQDFCQTLLWLQANVVCTLPVALLSKGSNLLLQLVFSSF